MVIVQYMEGAIDEDTWIRYWVNRVNHNKNNLVAVIGPTGCLDGSTKLFNNDKSLQELYEQGIRYVDTYSKDLNTHSHKLIKSNSEIIDSGAKEIYEVTLEDNKIILATLDHKFFIYNKGKIIEKKLSELTEGDNIISYSMQRLMSDKTKLQNHIKRKIISIKKIGIKHCYDLHTPIYHNFILDNGVLTHNSGKTYSAIKCCEMISERTGVPFGINNIVFTLHQLMVLINSGLPNKSAILFDEPQVSINSREFMSEANKVFNLLLTTFRHKNFTLFFCTPYEDLLDKTCRKLFHSKLEMKMINYGKKVTIVKPKCVSYNSHQSKFYEKYIKIKFRKKNGPSRTRKLKSWEIEKPSEDIMKLYEDKKLEFTTNLNKTIQDRLERYEEKHNPRQNKFDNAPKSFKEMQQIARGEDLLNGKSLILIEKSLSPKQKRLITLWDEGIRDYRILAEMTGVKQPAIHNMLRTIKSKGIPIRKPNETMPVYVTP